MLLGSMLFGTTQNSTKLFNGAMDTAPENKLRFNGVYSLYDTLKGNCDTEAYKRYVYCSPIMFFEDGSVIQSPHSNWTNPNFVSGLKTYKDRLDHGTFTANNNEITLKGNFTFFARGHDWRHYKAKFRGYFDTTGDTLFLKPTKPYPAVKLKFNKNLVRQIENDTYEKYIFKPLPKADLENIDQVFMDMVHKQE